MKIMIMHEFCKKIMSFFLNHEVQPSIEQFNRSSRQTWIIYHTKFILNKIQSFLTKKLGKNVCQLMICINKFKKNIIILHMIMQKVMYNVYMFGSKMLNEILTKFYSTYIVTFDRNMIKLNVIVPKLLFLP